MNKNFTPLSEPIPITEQTWPKGTIPLVSIAVLTYNHEAFIKQALDSFLMQETTFPVRICIFEDCSTDSTAAILKEYEAKYPQLFVVSYQSVNTWGKPFREEAKSNYYAAARIAKYIAHCEGDDYWTDSLKLHKQISFLEGNPEFVGVFHNAGYIDERSSNSEIIPWRVYERDIYEAKDTLRKRSLFHTSSYCYRNVINDFSYFIKPGLISGDMLLIGLISKYGKFKLLDETMSVYRRNHGGITSGENKIQFHRHRIILIQTLNEYFEYKFNERAKEIVDYHKNKLLKIKYPRFFRLKNSIKKILN